MNPISDTELASLRAEAASVLTTPCAIQTRSEQVGGAGGRKPVYTDTSTMCRVSPLSYADKIAYAEKLGSVTGWQISLPHDAEVTADDRLAANGQIYDILAITNQVPPILRRAICRRSS